MTMLSEKIGGGNAPIEPGSEKMRRDSSIMRAVKGAILIIVLIALLIVISASISENRAVGSINDTMTSAVVRQDTDIYPIGMSSYGL